MHVDIPEGKCRTHLDWECETVLVFFYPSQQGVVPVSQYLGFQEKMDDELRIVVAEALQRRAAREVDRCVTAPSTKPPAGHAAPPGLPAVALAGYDGQQRNRSRRLHYYVPRYQPR